MNDQNLISPHHTCTLTLSLVKLKTNYLNRNLKKFIFIILVGTSIDVCVSKMNGSSATTSRTVAKYISPATDEKFINR